MPMPAARPTSTSKSASSFALLFSETEIETDPFDIFAPIAVNISNRRNCKIVDQSARLIEIQRRVQIVDLRYSYTFGHYEYDEYTAVDRVRFYRPTIPFLEQNLGSSEYGLIVEATLSL